MSQRKNDFLPPVLNLMAGIGVLLISFLVEIRIPISARIAKSLGFFCCFCQAKSTGPNWKSSF